MEIRVETRNGVDIAVVAGGGTLITDGQSALDLMMTVRYETEALRIVLDKAALAEEFFDLRTGIAGEVAQKFINYNGKLAVVGDFSGYGSNSLRDYIRECNRGRDIFFLPTLEEALEKLAGV